MPKVSVVVPVYNVEKYLERCVESLRNQTLKDIEIILVDDGSPDNCPAMCDEYARKDSLIKVVHKQNAGLGMACNSGIEVATGDYIAFCDSDDWVDADMYETMYEAAVMYDSDVVFTGLKRVDASGKILGYLPHPNEFEQYEGDSILELAKDLIASNPQARLDRRIQVSAKTVLYRRTLLFNNNLNFVSERHYPSEDLIFNVSVLLKTSRAIILPRYLYNYYINLSSITSTVKPDHFKKMMLSASLLKELLTSAPITDEYSNKSTLLRISRFIIGESRSYSRQVIKSKLSKIQKKYLIAELLDNRTFRDSISTYPISEMPKLHRFALWLLLNKQYILLKFLYKM